jgi:hypothetical protein
MKNMKLTRLSIRLLLVLWGLTLIAGVVSAQLSAEELAEKDTMAKLAAAVLYSISSISYSSFSNSPFLHA